MLWFFISFFPSVMWIRQKNSLPFCSLDKYFPFSSGCLGSLEKELNELWTVFSWQKKQFFISLLTFLSFSSDFMIHIVSRWSQFWERWLLETGSHTSIWSKASASSQTRWENSFISAFLHLWIRFSSHGDYFK